MNIKAVVKVMNFHALLRVENSKKKAEKYSRIESELENVMGIVMNNKNLRLDKLIRVPDPSKPVLKIYIGSDYGFCGTVNSSVSSALKQDDENTEKIVIGKKVRRGTQVVKEFILQDEIDMKFEEIIDYLKRAVFKGDFSAIDLVYNHYYNLTSVSQEVRRVYPLSLKELTVDEEEGIKDDFVLEGDPLEMLQGMMVTYLEYQVKIAITSSYASENIMRQNATTESLKKIDEKEEEDYKHDRKVKNDLAFRKLIDNFTTSRRLNS